MSKLGFGLEYHFTLLDRFGRRMDEWDATNLVPNAGLVFLLKAPFGDTASISTFYLGLYANAFEPSPATVAADIPNSMGEITAYSEAVRPEWERAYSNGAYSSADTPAEFTMTSDVLVRGLFLCSAPAKGVGTGLLLSALRLSTARQAYAGSKLQVHGSLTYVPVS